MKRLHSARLNAFVAAVLVLVTVPAPLLALGIDNFEQGPFSIQDDSGFGATSTTQSGLGAPGSLGGNRSILVRNNSAQGFARLSLAPDSPDVLDDAVVLSLDPNVSAHAEITLLDVLPSSAYDLRAAGEAVRVIIEQAPIFGDIHIGFTDSQGRTSGRAINVTQPGEYHWAIPDGPTFDGNAITKLVMSFNVISSATPRDYRISDVSVVPEPAVPCAVALIGLLLQRRRRS